MREFASMSEEKRVRHLLERMETSNLVSRLSKLQQNPDSFPAKQIKMIQKILKDRGVE